MENNFDSRWVADRIAAVEPQWTPGYARGRALLDARIAPRRRSRTWMVAAAAVAILAIAIIAVPQGRALAQELWFRMLLTRVDVVRVDLSQMPLRSSITTNGISEAVSGVLEAEQKAGFRPNLPPDAGSPSLAVVGPIHVAQTIDVRALEAALAKTGARDVHVPPDWNGVTIRAGIAPMIIAGYPGEIQILQTRPIELFAPSGFPLDHFTEVAFRSIGLPWVEARALARRFASHPSWLLNIPGDEAVNVQEVVLRHGRGLLIEDFDDGGSLHRATVIFSTADRIYSVATPSRNQTLRIAGSL